MELNYNWVGILKYMKEHLKTGRKKLDINKLLEIKGITVLDDDKNLKFSGFGQALASCHMVFPDFEYYKSGLLGDDEALQNYFTPFHNHTSFVTDNRSFEKGRKPMAVSIFSSKGCVARCTFCHRFEKGYRLSPLDSIVNHLKMLKEKYNVKYLSIGDENFGS